MIDAHRTSPVASPLGAITILAVTPGTASTPAWIAAIRANDIRACVVDDALSLEVVPEAEPSAAALRAASDDNVHEVLFSDEIASASTSTCVQALNRVLKGATLAAWNVDETMNDLIDVLGSEFDTLECGGRQLLDVSSMVRLISPSEESFDEACEAIEGIDAGDVPMVAWRVYQMAHHLFAGIDGIRRAASASISVVLA